MRALLNWNHPYFCVPESSLWKKLVIATVTIASMTVLIDLLSVVVVLTEIQGYLAVDSTKVFWLARSYMFMMVITPFLAIRFAKNYGFKLLFFLGNILFISGAILCAFASDFWWMLLFRIIGGTGGGVILSVGMPIINFAVDDEKKRRPIVLAYNNVFFGFGIALGLLFGGYFGQTGHFELVFHINIFFTSIALILALFLFKESGKIATEPYDYLGFFLIFLFSLSLLMIVTQAKQPWNTLGWRSPFILSCSFLAVASLLTFIAHSLTTPCPLFDLRLFTYRPFLVGFSAMFLVSIMVFGVTMATLQMLQEIYLYEWWKLGTFMSLIGVMYCLVGLIPSVTSKYIDFRFYALLGMFLLAYSCFQAQSITIQSDKYELGAVILLRAAGVSLSLGSLTVWALLPFDEAMYAKGSSLITFIRQLGGVLGSGMIMTFADMRRPFHALRFGEQVDIYSGRFMQYTKEYATTLTSSRGVPESESMWQTNEYLRTWIENQAQIQGILDAEYILGWLFSAMFLIMLSTLIYVHFPLRANTSPF